MRKNRTIGFLVLLLAGLFVTSVALADEAPGAEGPPEETPAAGTPAAETPSESPAQPPQGEATGYRNVELTGSDRAHQMDDKRDYRNLVIAGPQFWLFIPAGAFLRYHRLLSDTLSLQVGAGYAGFKVDDTRFSAIRLLGGADYHPVGNGMHGFYVGPRVNYRRFGIDAGGDVSGSLNTLNFVGVGGYRAIWDPGFSLGIGLGGGYRLAVAEASATDGDGNEVSGSTEVGEGFIFVLEFTLGWAF